MWQREAVRGVGVEKDQAAMLAHAGQKAAQKLTGEQVGQLVQRTRSFTKAARTQAAQAPRTSTSKAPGSSSSSSSSSSSNSK